MKKVLLVILANLLLMLPAFGVNKVIEKAHKTTHKIQERYILGGETCSGTAVAPAALLTASHCELPTDLIIVDGNTPAKVMGILRDGNDHTIYLLAGIEFKDYAEIGSSFDEVEGSDVFIFGNPADQTDIFRRGVVAGFRRPEGLQALFIPKGIKRLEIWYDFNGYFGDSGSGIFDAESGKIVGVLSTGAEVNSNPGEENNASFKLMGGFDIVFTPEQLAAAQQFKPVKSPAPPAPKQDEESNRQANPFPAIPALPPFRPR